MTNENETDHTLVETQEVVSEKNTVADTAVKTSPEKKAAVLRKPKDKAKILAKIDALIVNGASTLKDALVKAGISKRTYYTWKREEPVVGSTGKDKTLKQPSKVPSPSKSVESETSFVDDLAKLEAEKSGSEERTWRKIAR